MADILAFGPWNIWGRLRDRYERRAQAGGPYRLLALDGGGIRGLITLPVLIELERLLRAAHGGKPGFRLCDFFDCIGGTSTGAIMAAGDLLTFYKEFGPEVFRTRSWYERWKSLYDNGPLETKLKAFVNGQKIPLAIDLGRRFLYARYNADLTLEGLAKLKLGDVEASQVCGLDSTDAIDDLIRVGKALAEQVSLDHLRPFLPS
jgi:Patatin-like phospholipase